MTSTLTRRMIATVTGASAVLLPPLKSRLASRKHPETLYDNSMVAAVNR